MIDAARTAQFMYLILILDMQKGKCEIKYITIAF
jgi:hypothetical protein